MSVRTRKNAIALAAGAILALTMPLTSITPASAESVLPAQADGPAAVYHGAALPEPIVSGTQGLTLRMVGWSPYFAAGPVYRHPIWARQPASREPMLRRCTHGAYQLVFPVRPVQVNQKCDCRPAPNPGSANPWRIVLASHPRPVARCTCGMVKRAHVLAARSARHCRAHRVRVRRVIRCKCRLVALVHRMHPAKCRHRLVTRVHRVIRRHVAKCGCRLVRHLSHVVRVVRHTHCAMRALHRAYRVAHVLPRQVRAVAVRRCHRAAARTTLLSFHRGSWNRPWWHRLGHGHHCGHWA
jgi:hypothetical protein